MIFVASDQLHSRCEKFDVQERFKVRLFWRSTKIEVNLRELLRFTSREKFKNAIYRKCILSEGYEIFLLKLFISCKLGDENLQGTKSI